MAFAESLLGRFGEAWCAIPGTVGPWDLPTYQYDGCLEGCTTKLLTVGFIHPKRILFLKVLDLWIKNDQNHSKFTEEQKTQNLSRFNLISLDGEPLLE